MIELKEALTHLSKTKEEFMEACFESSNATNELVKADNTCRQQAEDNLTKDHLFSELSKLHSSVVDSAQKAESNYHEWYHTGPNGDDVDFTVPYPETEKVLKPFVDKLQEISRDTKEKLNELLNAEEARIYDDIIAPKKIAVDDANKKCRECEEEYHRALEQLKWGCPELIVNGTVIDDIGNIIKDKVDNSYVQYDEFEASLDKVIIDGIIDVQLETDVDFDSFCDNLKDLPELDVESTAEDYCEQIRSVLKEKYLDYDFDVDYEIYNQDRECEKAFHKGYYEEDTGYGEPEGEFYYGLATNNVTLEFHITITKEEE